MRASWIAAAAVYLAALPFAHAQEPQAVRPPPGSNEMLRAPLTAFAGAEVIISDVVIPPNAIVPLITIRERSSST